jgi:hypothetical protein
LNPKQLANLLTTSAIRDESYKPDPVVKEVCTWNLKIELVALECPILLKNELMRLFPEAKLRDRRITLINFHEAVEENSDSDRAVDVTEKADSVSSFNNCLRLQVIFSSFWLPDLCVRL